jgi:transcriptional antiterminator
MNIAKFKNLIHLIEKERTGTPKELARRLELSERMVYNYVGVLRKDLNAPIVYNRFRQTYQFHEPGQLEWEWKSDLS